MPHQLIGVAWMKAQEESKHYGGILADEMGLGKTVESIALMCANESQDPDEKSTLIVAPLALLQQWKEEIGEPVVVLRFFSSVRLPSLFSSNSRGQDYSRLLLTSHLPRSRSQEDQTQEA